MARSLPIVDTDDVASEVLETLTVQVKFRNHVGTHVDFHEVHCKGSVYA